MPVLVASLMRSGRPRKSDPVMAERELPGDQVFAANGLAAGRGPGPLEIIAAQPACHIDTSPMKYSPGRDFAPYAGNQVSRVSTPPMVTSAVRRPEPTGRSTQRLTRAPKPMRRSPDRPIWRRSAQARHSHPRPAAPVTSALVP